MGQTRLSTSAPRTGVDSHYTLEAPPDSPTRPAFTAHTAPPKGTDLPLKTCLRVPSSTESDKRESNKRESDKKTLSAPHRLTYSSAENETSDSTLDSSNGSSASSGSPRIKLAAGEFATTRRSSKMASDDSSGYSEDPQDGCKSNLANDQEASESSNDERSPSELRSKAFADGEESDAEEQGPDTADIGDEDPGAAMLLMMRRNKGKSKASLPAPLSKAAIKTPATDENPAATIPLDLSRGLPSSHPYYRSSRVLASPVLRKSRSAKAGTDPAYTCSVRFKDDIPEQRASDVRYEQQRPRANVVYRYPLRPPMKERMNSWSSSESRPVSPRIYIPPPIFSPRRVPSDPSLQRRSSLLVGVNRDQLARPYRVASERYAGDLIINEIPASPLQPMTRPYRTANPILRAQQRQEMPSYADYFGDGHEHFSSPIRESFVRSNNDRSHARVSWENQHQTAYRGSNAVSYLTSSRHPLDSRGYERVPSSMKRGLPEDFASHVSADQRYREMIDHLRVPQELSINSIQSAPAKRARTDSAASSNSGSGGSPSSNRMHYIPPPHRFAGGHLIPHTAAGIVNTAERRRRGAYAKSPSPVIESQNGSSSRRGSGVSTGGEELASLLAQTLSGRAAGNATETARALADVAATLARVAESLQGKA